MNERKEQEKQHDFFPFLVLLVDEKEGEEDWFTPCWSQQQQEQQQEEYKWCNDIHQSINQH